MSISEVGREAGSESVRISTDGSWTLSLEFPASGGSWAQTDKASGQSSGIVRLTYGENSTGRDRTVKLVARCGERSSVWHFTQSSKSRQSPLPGGYREDPVGNWLEMPAVSSADGLYFFCHRHNDRGRETRDWSFYWDTKNLVAHWVAYPLNKGLVGSGSRTNAWGIRDPHLPANLQPDVSRPFRGYSRGHQLPSADRYKKGENERTFYGTNMTPQKSELNERAWAELESRVRSWAGRFDTLYVVTGCTVDNKRGTTRDASGKSVAVPGGYFKALLGFSRNTSASTLTAVTGGYTGIAFYFNHGSASDVMSHAMTIDELEAKLGMDFFVNLPSRIGEARSDRVESSNDDFWTKN